MRVGRQKPKILIANKTELLQLGLRKKIRILNQIKAGGPIDLPRQFWIEITNECNLRCTVCPLSVGLKRYKSSMTLNGFIKIIDQICITRPSVLLHVGGEPMLNKNLFKMIEYAKNKGCWVGMHTNATLLDELMAKQVLQSSLDWISMSFDGATREIYEKIRAGAKFEKVKIQIENFLQLRSEQKVRKLFVRIELLLTNDTKEHADEFIAYWQTKNLNSIGIRPAGDWLGLVDSPGKSKIKTFSHRPCRDVFAKCAVLVDGTIVPCCRDIEGRLPLGNIFSQSFPAIWNGDNYRMLRKQHIQSKIDKDSICGKCVYRRSWSRAEVFTQGIVKQLFYSRAKY